MVLDALVNTFESVLPLLAAQLDSSKTAILVGPPTPDYLQQVLKVLNLHHRLMRALAPYRRVRQPPPPWWRHRLPGMQAGSQRYFETHRSHVVALFDAGKDCRDETRTPWPPSVRPPRDAKGR